MEGRGERGPTLKKRNILSSEVGLLLKIRVVVACGLKWVRVLRENLLFRNTSIEMKTPGVLNPCYKIIHGIDKEDMVQCTLY